MIEVARAEQMPQPVAVRGGIGLEHGGKIVRGIVAAPDARCVRHARPPQPVEQSFQRLREPAFARILDTGRGRLQRCDRQ
jgi:hypothetical protein